MRKNVSNHLAILASLLILKSTLLLVAGQSNRVFCDPTARPVFCTPAYSPVCAYSFGCESSLCSYTAINACAACGQSDINYYTDGECFYNSREVEQYLNEELGANEGELIEGGNGSEAEQEVILPEEGNTPETELFPEEGDGGENNVPELEIPSEEVTIPEQENETETEETEQPTEQPEEQPVEQPGEQPVEENPEPVPEEEENGQSENEEPGDPSCPSTGVVIYVGGKFIRGTYCCGKQPTECNNQLNPVCGSLNQCIGSLCRQTKLNSCTACLDPNVKLHFPGSCNQLFGDAEVVLDPGNSGNTGGSDNSGSNGENPNGGGDDGFDFRMLKLEEEFLSIRLD